MDENIFPTVPLPTLDADVENIQKLDDEPNDVGGLTAAELKAEFDKGNVTIKKWINENFIPALQSADGASGIGAKDLNENASDVQTELDKLKNLGGASSTAEQVDQAVQDSHTHENKALLDTYTQTEEELSSAVIQKHSHDNKGVLDGIKEVTQSLGNSSDKVPSEKAVSEALVLAGGIPGGGYTQQVLKKRSDASFDLEWANDAVMVVDLGECTLNTPFAISEAQSSLLLNTNAPVARATINGQSVDTRRFSLNGTTALYSGILYDGGNQYFTFIKIDGTQATVSSGTAFNVNDIVTQEQLSIDLGDTTTPAKKLGLTGDLSVGASLGVLATAGDLYVWRRTVSSPDGKPEVPAGYTLGDKTNTRIVNGMSTSVNFTVYYSETVSVSDDGVLTLSSPSSSTQMSNFNTFLEENVIGKFFRIEPVTTPTVGTYSGSIYFVPEDCVFTRQTYAPSNFWIDGSTLQTVTGYPYQPAIPPGTVTVDYPVSVNPNAYQTGSDAKPAGYTLGAVEGPAVFARNRNAMGPTFYYFSYVNISEDGIVSVPQDDQYYGLVNSTSVSNANAQLKGMFLQRREEIYGDSDFGFDQVVFIPNDATFSLVGNEYISVDKYQSVTGYPAIPAGTTIEYLGKLGDKARIVTGSYVGTGTTTVSIPVDFQPKSIVLYGRNTSYANEDYFLTCDGADTSPDVVQFSRGTATALYTGVANISVTESGVSINYGNLNKSGVTYYYRFLG